jgi:hypothetical protein
MIALLLRLVTMYVPLGQNTLHFGSVELSTFVCLGALALSVFVAMEVYKWSWGVRTRRSPSIRCETLP